MNKKEKKVLFLTVLISILLHGVLLILLNYDNLFGVSAIAEQKKERPLEFVFEQPAAQKPEKKEPDKFYELVENPNANKQKPQQSGMLSTESSVSSSPVIKPGDLHAVPGTEAEKKQAPIENQKLAEKRETAKSLKSDLFAFRGVPSFDRSALSGAPRSEPKKPEISQEQAGESAQHPEGFNADMVGDFALSTYDWNWAPYWLAFKRKLMRVWYAPPAYSQLGLIHGYTIVRFKITRDGKMYDFKVLQQVGHQSLEESSVSAMRAMFPFLALPSDFPDEYLEVTIKLIYPDLRKY